MECRIFARLEAHLTICFSQKNQLKRTGTAIIMFYICDYFDLRIMNFKGFCLPASQPPCQPAVRLDSARCMAPEIQHNKGYPMDL